MSEEERINRATLRLYQLGKERNEKLSREQIAEVLEQELDMEKEVTIIVMEELEKQGLLPSFVK